MHEIVLQVVHGYAQAPAHWAGAKISIFGTDGSSTQQEDEGCISAVAAKSDSLPLP